MSNAKSLRFAAPLTPSQAALRERPFRIGDWLLEPEAGRLVRDGRAPLTLADEQVLTLVMLADRAGTAVPDETLLATIWPAADGDAGALHAAIASLELILDREPASDPTFERAPEGYRLRSPVRLLATDDGSWRAAKRDEETAAEEDEGADGTVATMLWPLAVTLAVALILLLVLALR